MSPYEVEAKKILDPILDVFGGADGGIALSKLRHSMLPSMLEKFEDDKAAAEFVRAVEKFSFLCDVLLKK